jgi:hypothetical protein
MHQAFSSHWILIAKTFLLPSRPSPTHIHLFSSYGGMFSSFGGIFTKFIIEDPKTDFDIMGHQWVHQVADFRRGNSFAILAPTSGVCYHLVIHAYHVLSFYSYYQNLSLWIRPRIYFLDMYEYLSSTYPHISPVSMLNIAYSCFYPFVLSALFIHVYISPYPLLSMYIHYVCPCSFIHVRNHDVYPPS